MASRELKHPSDLFDAIVEVLEDRLAEGVEVATYEKFSGSLNGDSLILIEFESSSPAVRGHDGRYCHEYLLTLHGLVSAARDRAEVEAVNLSAALERVVDCNRWGFAGRDVYAPDNIRSAPSMFKKGESGYEAWGTSFTQKIFLGKSLLPDDPVVKEIWLSNDPAADESGYEKVSELE